jgi:hypothetical protein
MQLHAAPSSSPSDVAHAHIEKTKGSDVGLPDVVGVVARLCRAIRAKNKFIIVLR